MGVQTEKDPPTAERWARATNLISISAGYAQSLYAMKQQTDRPRM